MRQQGRRVTDAAAVAVVLAGGRATRMGGGDKALRPFAGATLLDAVLGRIAPQVRAVAISANGDPARFAAWGLPVLPDPVPDRRGPLAGVLAGLHWAASAHRDVRFLLSVPTDTPFLPPDLVAGLSAAGTAGVAVAESGGRLHPVVALWPVTLADALAATLDGGERRVWAGIAALGMTAVPFPDGADDPFRNVNTPDDLAAAEHALRRRTGACDAAE